MISIHCLIHSTVCLIFNRRVGRVVWRFDCRSYEGNSCGITATACVSCAISIDLYGPVTVIPKNLLLSFDFSEVRFRTIVLQPLSIRISNRNDKISKWYHSIIIINTTNALCNARLSGNTVYIRSGSREAPR